MLALLASAGVLALTRLVPSTPLTLALFGRHFELLAPRALQLGALVPWLVWASSSSLGALSRARRVSALVLRSLGVLAGALALALPEQRVFSSDTATVLVVDVSDSIDDATLAEAQRYVARVLAQTSTRHRVSLVRFAGEATATPLPARADPAWSLARLPRGRATNLERALALAEGLLPAHAVPQIALFSDGRETHGDLARAAETLRAHGVRLFVRAASAALPEVGILDLKLPGTIRVGEPFMVEARVVASTPVQLRARLVAGERDNEPDSERTVHVGAGETTLRFRSLVRRAGHVRYALQLTPLGPDRFADNNRFVASTTVRGAPRVLVIAREPTHVYPFVDLLRAAAFEVELRTPERAPSSATELDELAFYVLADVPAAALTRASLDTLVGYVHDGGGLLITGGEHSFGLGGYQGSALQALLPVVLEGSSERELPSLALVLAIDKSGSMAGDKLERAKEAAIATAELLAPDSYLGVIGFDAEPTRIVRLALVSPRTVARSVGLLVGGGGTALFPALDAAYADLAGVRARKKHVVVLTDGQTQEESLDALADSMRADGITISTIGLGEDVNRGLLLQLAARAGGRSYFTRDPARIPRLFAEEAELLARSSVVEARQRVLRALPADFLKGIAIEGAPALGGYVATRPRPAPAELILQSERGEPILARMRVGLGWSLALTTDVSARWSADWYRWRQLSTLFAQLVREHQRADPGASLPIETRLEGDTLVAAIDVLDERARFVNDLTGQLSAENDRGLTRTAELSVRAPGRYEARVPLAELGSYTLRARLERAPDDAADGGRGRPGARGPSLGPAGAEAASGPGEPRVVLAAGSASLPFPAEYRPPFAPDTTRLARAAERTGGGALPAPEALLAAGGRLAEQRRERWQPLVWTMLALFLMDLVARRARLPTARARQGT